MVYRQSGMRHLDFLGKSGKERGVILVKIFVESQKEINIESIDKISLENLKIYLEKQYDEVLRQVALVGYEIMKRNILKGEKNE